MIFHQSEIKLFEEACKYIDEKTSISSNPKKLAKEAYEKIYGTASFYYGHAQTYRTDIRGKLVQYTKEKQRELYKSFF